MRFRGRCGLRKGVAKASPRGREALLGRVQRPARREWWAGPCSQESLPGGEGTGRSLCRGKPRVV